MAKYWISGANTSAIEGNTGVLQYVTGSAVTSGRTFWLRSLWYSAHVTSGKVSVWDGLEDATAGGAATSTVMMILPSATEAATGGDTFRLITIPEPGLKFSLGCCMSFAASGTIVAGGVGACGYEA